ncbi:MAG: 4Fe-4S dicluster domain-containing protein [Raoultibacter sp.]
MGSFKLGKMTLGAMFKTPETIQYPAQTRFVPEGLKGHIEIDIGQCILCSICEKHCPTGAIAVDKSAETWTINRFRCIQCGYCVRECPKNCLTMAPTYAPPAAQKSLDVFKKPALSEEEKAAKEAKEAAKAAKLKAALEAKAAREQE